MKRFLLVSVFILTTSFLNAYNPPINGENFLELSSPKLMTNGASSSGGGIFSTGPDSLVVNPALTATDQRVVLNLAYTGLFSSQDANAKYGNAFQAGILIPFKWAVFSGYLNGSMLPFESMQLGNSINLKAGLAKEITEKLDIGLNLNTGMFWGYNFDWELSANLGFLYKYGTLGFVKDFRYSASLLNLGKNYSKVSLNPINKDKAIGAFPGIATLKIGAAGLLFSNDLLKFGASLDLTFPTFQNVIIDMGLEFSVKDMLCINVAEKFNIAELANGHKNIVPSVGLFFKFDFDVKNNEYLAQNGWEKSEMTTAVAYKNLYDSINAISASVDVNLGMKDENPPEIIILVSDE